MFLSFTVDYWKGESGKQWSHKKNNGGIFRNWSCTSIHLISTDKALNGRIYTAPTSGPHVKGKHWNFRIALAYHSSRPFWPRSISQIAKTTVTSQLRRLSETSRSWASCSAWTTGHLPHPVWRRHSWTAGESSAVRCMPRKYSMQSSSTALNWPDL